MAVDLTDHERQLLANILTVEIEASRFPLSPRIEAPGCSSTCSPSAMTERFTALKG